MRAELKNKENMRHVFLFIGLLSLINQTDSAGVSDDLKKVLSDTDFNRNINQLMSEIQEAKIWEAFDVSYFDRLSTDNLNRILREGRNVAERTKALIRSLLASNENDIDSILNYMRSSTVSDAEIAAFTDTLNSDNNNKPEKWKEDFINRLGTEPLKRLSNGFLLKVKDENAIKRLMDQVEALRNSESNPKKRMRFENMLNNFVYKMAENIEKWNEFEAKKFPINRLTPDLIMKMKPSLVSIMNESLAQEARSRTGCQFGRAVVKQLMKGKLSDQSSNSEFGFFFEELGNEFKKYVFPEDLKVDIRYAQWLEGILKSNVRNCMANGDMSPKSRSLYRQDYDIEVTSAVINSEGPCAIGVRSLEAVKKSLQYLNDGSRREVDKCISGADQNAKRMAMIVQHENKQQLSRSVAYSNLPDNVVSFGTRFGGTSASEAVNILRKEGINLTDEQMEKLIAKINSGSVNSLSKISKGSVPYSKIKDMSSGDLGNMAFTLSGQSLACLTASKRIFGTKSSLSIPQLQQNSRLLKCMSRMDANKIDENIAPFEITRQLKDAIMSTSMAIVLRDRLIDATTDPFNSREAVKKMSVSDIENIPVAVMAAFGSDLSNLNTEAKEYLLMRMGRMEQISEIPLKSQKIIVELGLETNKRGNALLPGDLDLVGQAYMDIPASMLKNANYATKKMFLDKVNADIKAGKLNILCITPEMTDGIAKSIKDVYGKPENFDSMDGIDCLMWAPAPWSFVQSIEKEVLDDASCKLPPLTYALSETAEANCLEANDGYYKSVLEMEKQLEVMQKKSLVSIMERDVYRGPLKSSIKLGLTPCEKGSILGVESMNSVDLDRMDNTEVMDCVQYMGMMDMSRSRAKSYIVDKVLRLKDNNPRRLTEIDITKLGSAFKGFSADQISRMDPSIFLPTKETVRSIGTLELDNDQVTAVANMVKANMNSLARINREQLMSLGNIICGFSSEELRKIPRQTIQDVMPMLKRIKCPNSNFENSIPDLNFDQSSEFDAAEIRDMGVLIAKMRSDFFEDIEPEAYAGFTPEAMKMMNSAQLNKMDPDGLENLQYEAALALSSGQISSFKGERKKAALEARSLEGMASGTTASLVFVVVLIFITNFL